MKKVVVILAVASLMASSAMASSVVNSKHNLATGGPGTIKSTNYDEVCVFCHTPHAADTTVTLAPLWNRTIPVGLDGSTATYNSATIESATDNVTGGDIGQTDAPLCLSCHDGSSLTDDLKNPSNLAANAQPLGLGALPVNANIGLDFSNDHPIGFDYNTVYSSEVTSGADGLHDDPDVGTNIQFFSGEMWCSSCHDVHDDANYPFLTVSNAASALCLECHNK